MSSRSMARKRRKLAGRRGREASLRIAKGILGTGRMSSFTAKKPDANDVVGAATKAPDGAYLSLSASALRPRQVHRLHVYHHRCS